MTSFREKRLIKKAVKKTEIEIFRRYIIKSADWKEPRKWHYGTFGWVNQR